MQSKDWKEIPGYDGRYYVSKMGEIYSGYLKRKMKPFNRGNGYLTVRLSVDGKVKNIMVHQLVAAAFIPNPNQYKEIDHIDGNKENNVYTNLRYVSHVDNMRNPITEPKRHNAIRKKQGIAVIAFLNGKEIGKYSCIMEAARDLRLSGSQIAKHLKGRFTNVKGYKFERNVG